MAEIKHTFTAGRMNKDLDERLVPNGEYRDALNIQVRTTDGDASGTVQNMLGNTPVHSSYTGLDAIGLKVIGSVADEKDDRSYHLMAAPKFDIFNANGTLNQSIFTGTRYWRDSIVELQANGISTNVVVDNFAITERIVDFNNGNDVIVAANWNELPENVTVSASNYRVGMQLQAYTDEGVAAFKSPPIVVKVASGTVSFDRNVAEAFNATACKNLVWTHPKMLGLDQDNLVTGINVIDEFLFYTTGDSEPKKINIRRAKAGTAAAASKVNLHTKLFVDPQNGGPSKSILNYELNHNEDLLEKHITVIKKPPSSAPTLVMSNTVGSTGATEFVLNNQSFFLYPNGDSINIGDQVYISEPPSGVQLIAGDEYILQESGDTDPAPVVKVRVDAVGDNSGGPLSNVVVVTLLSRSANTTNSHLNWEATIEEEEDSLFELKFVRFGTRFKYNDNEYSSFSPFSEVAFLPGEYEFNTKKGYNLGMVNTLKDLRLKNVIPTGNEVRIDEVKSIDILYKSTDSPVVYVIKTIDRDLDPEWEKLNTGYKDVEIRITSSMVHKVVPSDQILRSWDNVPRFAKAQEIIASRLAYANYTQGYNLPISIGLEQVLVSNDLVAPLSPEKSIKSLRSYRFGVVIGDKYGRETPVISTGTRIFPNESLGGQSISGSDYLSKSKSVMANSFCVTQKWNNDQGSQVALPTWADYAKYYVKETSNEYYNLVMDRWYNAEDGNVWISFPSVDRNKVDENTFLILKKDHGTDSAVLEEAKYKIIAIENEAPEFIKQDNRIVTKVSMTGPVYDNEVVTYTNGVALDLTSGNSFDLPPDTFAFQEFKGTLMVRVVAESMNGSGLSSTNYLNTSWKPVSNMSPSNIKISFPWGDEADFVQDFIDLGSYSSVSAATTGDGAIQYFLEFMDQVIVNKPEFDGRFFVKLERDSNIDSYILKTSDDFNFIPAEKLYFGYVKSVFANPSNSSITFGGYDSGIIPDANNNFFPSTNIQDNITKQKKFWKSFRDQASQRVFIDAADHNHHIWATTSNSTQTISQDSNGQGSGISGAAKFTLSGEDRGFAKSGFNGVNTGTCDRIFFSIHAFKGGTNDWGQSQNFYDYMTNPGTRFSFKSDPNQVVYQIISGGTTDNPAISGTVTLRNHGPVSSSSGINYNAITDPTGFGVRRSFYTTFRKLVNNEITDEGIDFNDYDPRGSAKHDGSEPMGINILETVQSYDGELLTNSKGAVWETEPKDDTDLDIYYEASNAIPMKLNSVNTIEFAPLNSVVKIINPATAQERVLTNSPIVVSRVFDSVVDLKDSNGTVCTDTDIALNDVIVFTHPDGTETRSIIDLFVHNDVVTNGVVKTNSSTRTGRYRINRNVYKNKVKLNWSNCYTFGNGVESDRIRDDFNAPTIDNGVNASTSLLDYKREDKYNSIIYSSIFNPNSNFNGLNEFNMSQQITKDLNPVYGKIQALKARDTDLVTFTEDKVLRILANKDALFNADGNTNITASNRVLGQAVPYVGDYGISNNPESLAVDQYRMYFTDKQRGAVLRLSRDGLTPISNVGMKTWFRDNLRNSNKAIGSFDTVNGEYNLSVYYKPEYVLDNITVSFNEAGKGWVSFRSFVAESGLSISGEYFTTSGNKIYRHHTDKNVDGTAVNRNNFYRSNYSSSMTMLFNDSPGSIKNFKTLNYEGSTGYQVGINNLQLPSGISYTDGDYSNVTSTSSTLPTKDGWRATKITTDLQSGRVVDFDSKEGKWFGKIVGQQDTIATDDPSEFSTQGLGIPSAIAFSSGGGANFELTIEGGG